MPVVADFVTFSDVSFDLQFSGNSSRTLTEEIAVQPQSGEGGLLLWNVRREGTGSVSYSITINDGNTTSFTIDDPEWRSIQEVVSTGAINQGQNNVVITVTGGTGRLSIGDVTLMYRLNV